ncbi:MAG: eukaryotic-like serine/threonine-protein kinase [Solirubrobacteraceae bacterium]|nr:eukaryotic-like serine/threonine-protein kinase [Solirubrobacteraceae bacterium]
MARVACRRMPVSEASIALPPRYRVVRHIANGGMASVWAAEDELLGRLVAVKVLAGAYAADDRANRRFLREARAGARLSDCRNVVTVYDIGEHDDRPFMVMEHFAGGTVADRLRRGMSIPRLLALRWLREAAIALDCAHEHNVVHRDVKPANLLLDQRGRLAVGDFGIATVATEASVTQTGQVLGTAAYISPEQARGDAATAASDRYALAVVAFELLTGARPFAGDHPAAQARAHVEDAAPLASEAGRDLSPAVDRVLQAAMAKDPERRPASAGRLVEALEDALEDGRFEVDPAPTATTVAAPRPVARPAIAAGGPSHPTTGRVAAVGAPAPRRRLSVVGALLALVLVAGAAIAIAAGTGTGQRSARSSTAAAAPPPKVKPKTTAAKPKPATTSQPAATATPSTASTPAASATTDDPVALNDQGFALLQQSLAGQAVPLLQRSVDAFRQQGATSRIDYAYALYNLGNALRLTGRPDQAIPLLQERLRVSDYKRGVVRRELALSMQQSGQAPAGAGGGQGGRDHGHQGDGGD